MAKKNAKNIYHRKDGRWEGRYYTNDNSGNKKTNYIYGKTYEDVEEKLKEKQDFLLKMSNQMKISELAEYFLSEKKMKLKLSSYKRYELIIGKYILPNIGEYKPIQLNQQIFDKFKQNLETQGLSETTIRDIFTLMNMIIHLAEEKMVAKLTTIKSGEIKLLTDDEVKSLIRYLKSDIDYVKIGVLLTIFTGIKVGELSALKWEDLDLDNKRMYVSKTIQRVSDKSPGSIEKTRIIITNIAERCIPIQDHLVNILRRYKKQGYLLTGKKYYMEPRNIQYKFKSFCEEAKIHPTTFTNLRDTMIVNAIKNGMNLMFLAEISGLEINSLKKYFSYVEEFSENQKFEEMKKIVF